MSSSLPPCRDYIRTESALGLGESFTHPMDEAGSRRQTAFSDTPSNECPFPLSQRPPTQQDNRPFWREDTASFPDVVEVDEVLGDLVADVEVDDPVHEVEAEEGEREEDAAPLVDVGRRDPHHLVQLLRLARQDRRQRNRP